jgi:hypothetical protein
MRIVDFFEDVAINQARLCIHAIAWQTQKECIGRLMAAMMNVR